MPSGSTPCWSNASLIRVRQRGGVVPVAGPRLDDDLVQEDVAERRVVALVARLLLGFVESRARAVEVVDVAEPLAQLEHDPAVDRHRQRRRRQLQRLCALCRRRVVPVPEEELGTHTCTERRGGERRLVRLVPLEKLARRAGRVARLLEVDRARVHRELGETTGALQQAVGALDRLRQQACGGRFALVPVVDLGERGQRTRAAVARHERLEQLLEDRACAREVAREVQMLRELELQPLRLLVAGRHEP